MRCLHSLQSGTLQNCIVKYECNCKDNVSVVALGSNSILEKSFCIQHKTLSVRMLQTVVKMLEIKNKARIHFNHLECLLIFVTD